MESTASRHDRIVIFGPYKSGTTGLFYKIRNSLPGKPRLLFEPSRYDSHDDDARTGVLAKVILGLAGGAPAFDYDSFRGFEKTVLLVRDPRDWLLSGILFLPQQHPEIYRNPRVRSAIIALLERKEREPDRVPFTEVFNAVTGALAGGSPGAILAWITAQLDWLAGFEETLAEHLRIRYEDFIANKLGALEAYLGLRLSGSAKVDPEHNHVPRAMIAGDWRNWFLEEDADLFAPHLSAFIRHYDYDPEWAVDQPRRIAAAHASGFVERTMAKRLRGEGADDGGVRE